MSVETQQDEDLTAQVTVLSTKLLEAIDSQADLEDQVQMLRKELDISRRKNLEYEDHIRAGLLVSKSRFLEQVNLRSKAERESSRLQGEIEELTSSLFNEANKMVADANRETSVWGRKNEQLMQQLKERDILLESLQEQLSALKGVLERVSDERDQLSKELMKQKGRGSQLQDDDAASTVSSDPNAAKLANNSSTANLNGISRTNSFFNEHDNTDDESWADSLDDNYPVSLHSLWRPVVRHDLNNFMEFLRMIPSANAPTANSTINTPADSSMVSGRSSPAAQLASNDIPSPSNNITNPFSVSSESATNNSNNNTHSSTSSTSSTSNFSSLASRLHTFTNNSNSSSNNNNNTTNNVTTSSSLSLKDFKFFKRSIADDIEPTLRLDSAPGLNWLSRRNLLSSILEGSIKIEPIAAVNEGYKLVYSTQPYGSSNNTSYTSLPTSSEETPGATNATRPSSYYTIPSMGIASTDGGNRVFASLVASNNMTSPIATLAPCSFCGEKRTSSLLYARLHNLRSDKEKEKNSEKTHNHSNSTESVTSQLGHLQVFSSLPTYSNGNSSNVTTPTTPKDSDSKSIHTINESEYSYQPLTPTTSGISSSATVNNSGGNPSSILSTPGPTNSNSNSNSSSGPTSSGHPLCYHCLNRVRTVCDYIAFIRAIRMGAWRADEEVSRYKAWEECVRLKERMFWARQGGNFLKSEEEKPIKMRFVNSKEEQERQMRIEQQRLSILSGLNSKNNASAISHNTITQEDDEEDDDDNNNNDDDDNDNDKERQEYEKEEKQEYERNNEKQDVKSIETVEGETKV